MGAEPAQATQSSGPGSIEVGDFKIQSSEATEEQLRAQFADEIDEDAKKAASKLGKKGAQARAKKAQESEDQTQGSGEAPRRVHTPETDGSNPSPATTSDEDDESTDEKKASESEPEDEDGDEQEDKESEKDKKLGKPRNDPRARMLQATRQLAEERRAHQETRSQIDELRAEIEAMKTGKTRSPNEPKAESRPHTSERPDPAQYDDYESYLDARDEWNLRRWTEQAQKQAQREAAMSEQDRALSQAIQKFRESVGQDVSAWSEEVLSLKTEFQLADGERPSGENWIANELVFNPESAAPLGLYLSQHPDEFQRIASLSTPRDVSRAMAKLEARLEAANAGNGSERVEKSKAAPPIKPVRGAPYVSDGDPGPKPGESFDAWFKRTRPGNPYR